MHTWNPAMIYSCNNQYKIDNSLTESSTPPLTIECKDLSVLCDEMFAHSNFLKGR